MGFEVGRIGIEVQIENARGVVNVVEIAAASPRLETLVFGPADIMGVPASTTHILASGIAGAMFANQSGLQAATVRNIVLAWVLTIPACMLLGSVLFAASLFVVLRLAG